ncbi:MAG: DNA topoisomerase I [Candidatus Methanomethylicia archaeon]|nr:DNA topoisomerase I [Candidatus Methanomethylicia archaeon]
MRRGSLERQLIICEKPSAAEKIAFALGGAGVRRSRRGKVPVYRFELEGKEVTVVPSIGHLYAAAQQGPGWSFPMFSLVWAPIHEVERRASGSRAWIRAISDLAAQADSFVSACDLDTEGSLIAYMILLHACRGADSRARRMRFSTLTRQDLQAAYAGMTSTLDYGAAEAGKARHELDWIFGVNVSRALMDSYSRTGSSFEVLSAGRVQSPVLYALAKREAAIRLHLPDPFWLIGAEAEVGGGIVQARLRGGKVLSKREGEEIASRCSGAKAVVSRITEREVVIPPPFPFDLGTLQSEASRIFGFHPSRTQKIAEKLYLEALISYPRTASQKIPPSINCVQILRGLAGSDYYREMAEEILASGRTRPREGKKSDPAHPAIHPTGALPRSIGRDEGKVYDLVVKRFLAAFGEAAVQAQATIELECSSGDVFVADGKATKEDGWTRFYKPYAFLKEALLPKASVGDGAKILTAWAEGRFTAPPPRFTASSAIRFMERNGLGTKSTRAEVLDTLYRRGYIDGWKISVTELGFGVTRILKKFFPDLVSIELTRRLEEEIEGIGSGERRATEVVLKGIDLAKGVCEKMIDKYEEVGDELSKVVRKLREERRTLGPCPECKSGMLIITHSRKSGKRFVGCNNYKNGCRVTMPLPQRGRITPSKSTCKVCGYPIIEVRGFGKRPWRLCVNNRCGSKGSWQRGSGKAGSEDGAE